MGSKRNSLVIVGAFLTLLTLLPLFAPWLGLDARYSVATLRTLVSQAGPWGGPTFVALFVVLVVIQIPAFALVIAAPTLFAPTQAWLLCVAASYLSVLLNFAIVRKLGGQPLASLSSKRPVMARIFAQLNAHPVRTVVLLRMLTVMFPPVTSALALTQLRTRDHALGSLLGIPLPITGLLLAAGALARLSAS
jgi:uncharacterized membrane protein YdjX (TVP38/TMEM64 family)